MARISVEQSALTDARYSVMAGLLGVSRHDALGRMVIVWNQCQESGSYVLSSQILNRMFDDAPTLSDVLVKSGLAKPRRNGLYICGTKGRIEWLTNKRLTAMKNGQRGGRPKGKKSKPIKNQRRLRPESPPAPSPASTPSPARVERERLSTTTREGKSTEPTEDWLRMKVREIRNTPTLIEMSVREPNDYIEAVRDLTGYSPDELADRTGDDAIRPHQEEPHADL